MNAKIHRTAIVDDNAIIGDDVVIGEYAVVRGNVRIGNRVEIGSHVLIEAFAEIGDGTRIFHSSSVGVEPQDLKYRGEPTKLVLGENNIIREFASIHRGTVAGGGATAIGSGNLLMAFVHIAHDCIIGDGNILANAVNMGGHVTIGNNVIVGGITAIHQFVHIGDNAMIAASSYIMQDVLPYALVSGNPARVSDINRIGLRRKNIPSKTIDAIHKAIVILTRQGLSLQTAIEKIKSKFSLLPEIEKILDFVENRSKRGIMRGERVRQ